MFGKGSGGRNPILGLVDTNPITNKKIMIEINLMYLTRVGPQTIERSQQEAPLAM